MQRMTGGGSSDMAGTTPSRLRQQPPLAGARLGPRMFQSCKGGGLDSLQAMFVR